MIHVNELVQRLRPLGVYSFAAGSYSLGELEALGGVLDSLDEQMQEGQRESIVMTAEGEGLEKMETLFRYRGVASEPALRRAAIAGFLQIGGDSFTLSALNRCLSACGVSCLVEETGQVNQVQVRFPDVMGIPEGFPRIRVIMEDILPCQLEILYYFRYCTWGETMALALRWMDLNAMSWHDWMHLRYE